MSNYKKEEFTFQKYWKSLTAVERTYYLSLVSRLEKMREIREKKLKEFNNVTYSERYDLNREADLGYTDLSEYTVARNSEDSITKLFDMSSGATRNKITAIVSHLAQFILEANIESYDKENNMVEKLGQSMEDMILRSREIEEWQTKYLHIYRELVSQGNVFVEELYVREPKVVHDNGTWVVGNKISDFKPDKNRKVDYEYKCETKMHLGKDVYLSNLRQPDIQKQDLVAVWEELSLDQAELKYGSWDRWDFVKATVGDEGNNDIANIVKQDKKSGNVEWGIDQHWNLRKPIQELGQLRIMDRNKKTYMIILNGIMMLPLDYSLYEISPSGLIPFGKGDAEIITGFTYSKGVADTTFADNKMADAVYNSMVQKMLQSAKPTMGNLSGQIIPKNLLYSSRLISGLRGGQFQPLLPPESRQITQSETTFFTIAKQVLADKTVDDTFAGQTVDTKTATEYLERKKNTIMKLYSLVVGVMNLEEQLIKLRIPNILTRWTEGEDVPIYRDILKLKGDIFEVIGREDKPSMKKKYRTESVSSKQKRADGKQGYKIFRFHDDTEMLPQSDWDIRAEEIKLEKQYQKPVFIDYVNVNKLRQCLEYFWKIEIIPRKEEDSRMEAISFIDVLARTQLLFPTEKTLKKEGVLQSIAEKIKVDSDKIFNKDEATILPPQNGNATMENPLNKGSRGQLELM